MNSSNYRRPGAFSPQRPSSPGMFQSHISRPDRSESDSSGSSYITGQSRDTQSPQPHQQSQLSRPPLFSNSTATSSNSSINNFSRPSVPRNVSNEPSMRSAMAEGKGHRRQHSQGFFEPTLPSATLSEQPNAANLSQMAAQAAMQHQSVFQHSRQRSQTIPSPQNSPPPTLTGKRKPPPIQTVNADSSRKASGSQTPSRPAYNGAIGGHSAAATTAANAAFPRSPQLSPALPSGQQPEKEHKLKSEKSKMKLFSKPKDKLGKEPDRDKPLPSPNKGGSASTVNLAKMVNPSVTSLADSLASGASSIYSMTNTSTSTLVPLDRQTANEKEKAHKHHFLSRQKNKLRDRIGDDHSLPLSSASSNSRPIDPSAPSSIYSFAPAPASPAASSFSGLDLRHGGRALREKRKEEKALPFAPKKSDLDKAEWIASGLGTPGGGYTPSMFGGPPSAPGTEIPSSLSLQGHGLNNMRPEDAWDFLRAKLLVIFEKDEELLIPVEDLNRLVTIHIKRSIVKRLPTLLLEDLRGLLQTGFVSLDYTLRAVPDHRLVPHLVDMWLFVFGTILPYMQAVFLPLDLEFKGHGSLLSPQDAAEFWGANPDATDDAFGNEFDVRRITLLSYRDHVVLPHFDALLNTFSRLSLDSINVNPSTPVGSSFEDAHFHQSQHRPGTAGSLDPGVSSFNSQSSTLVNTDTSFPSTFTTGSSSLNQNQNQSRSRATSNLSAPELPSFGSASGRRPTPATTTTSYSTSHHQQNQQSQPDSAMVTETIARMLQCVAVLASVQSGDEAQARMEQLAKALKLNWLGRGRTGRNRRGFVGARVGAGGGGVAGGGGGGGGGAGG